MPFTDRPDVGNNIVWPTGVDETSFLVASGTTKRVNTDMDISARDINSLRHAIEAISNHVHEYSDAVGGGC